MRAPDGESGRPSVGVGGGGVAGAAETVGVDGDSIVQAAAAEPAAEARGEVLRASAVRVRAVGGPAAKVGTRRESFVRESGRE